MRSPIGRVLTTLVIAGLFSSGSSAAQRSTPFPDYRGYKCGDYSIISDPTAVAVLERECSSDRPAIMLDHAAIWKSLNATAEARSATQRQIYRLAAVWKGGPPHPFEQNWMLPGVTCPPAREEDIAVIIGMWDVKGLAWREREQEEAAALRFAEAFNREVMNGPGSPLRTKCSERR